MASHPRSRKSLPAALAAVMLALVAGYFGLDLQGGSSSPTDDGGAASTSSVSQDRGIAECEPGSLPRQAEDTAEDILAGGPFDYPDNDNARFGNYEGILPKEPSGYYREYTVETPGIDHRGARRIVTGGGSTTDPEVWYYTADHYESFCEIPQTDITGWK